MLFRATTVRRLTAMIANNPAAMTGGLFQVIAGRAMDDVVVGDVPC
jgi:hypothetical protein